MLVFGIHSAPVYEGGYIVMLAILISIILLVVLAFKRVNIVVVGIVSASVMALLSGQPLISAIKDDYMSGAAGFVHANFLIFFFSVLFGRIMELTGAAASISKFLADKLGEKYAILGVIFAGAILVYGGVTTLVVVFSLYPIALDLFKKANLPRYLLPGAIAGGCFTFACANFPGTPNLVNVIPIPYLGTTSMAAPLAGCITGVAVMLLVIFYFLWEAKRARSKGMGFIEDENVKESLGKAEQLENLPSPFLAVLPIVLILIVLNILKQDVIVAMITGILLCSILFYKNVNNVREIFNYSAKNAAIAIINTAVVVGFGSVVKNSTGFADLLSLTDSIGGHPYVSFGTMTTLLAGACGSGLGIALETMADKYLAMGINPEVLHRIGSTASVGLDSLPHNGAVITLLTISGLTHKEAYKYIMVPTVIFTLIGLAVCIGICILLYPI